MKIGIVLNTNEAETAWNALRLGVMALGDRDEVKLFLMGKGVELEDITDERFNIQEQIEAFMTGGGIILGCGTCLKMRQRGSSDVCPVSTMRDLLNMVKESDRILTFG